MQKTLPSLELDKYFQLLNDTFEKNLEGLIICDDQASVLWSKIPVEKKNIKEAIKLAGSSKIESTYSEVKVHTLNLPSKKNMFYAQLRDEQEESLGFLLVQINSDESNNINSSQVSAKSLIYYIAQSIQYEYKLTHELNSMAGELAERYDELNLLYTTDDNINSSRELHHLLKQLVINCTEYLDVEIASLMIPDKAININYSSSEHSKVKLFDQVQNIKDIIYQKVIRDKKGIVINNRNNAADICPESSCKVLASPVFDSNGSVIGALMIVKDKSYPDYVNSDRNLLDVMSLKISKLIDENYDVLTGLINRSGFEVKVTEYLQSSRTKEKSHCLLNIDIDNLQVINDTISYQAGNTLIHEVAEVIKKQVRDSDIVARTGGNAFGVILDSCPLEHATHLAEKIRQSVKSSQFNIDEHEIKLTLSIGVVSINKDSQSVASVLSASEVACSAAKEMGKNKVQIYQEKNQKITSRKDEMKWVSRIQSALSNNRFQLFCQVIEPLKDSKEHFNIEILLRLLDDNDKILTPWSFIPAAERYSLMPEIDRWVVAETLNIFSDYWSQLKGTSGKIAINLSGQTLGEKHFLDFVIQQTEESGIPTSNICFEVTESAAISNLENAKHFISELHHKGFQFSLDDFGTGLSSFSYLKTLNVDYLKIDGSFVKEILNDPISETMVAAINQVGHVMGLKTIAEYVENEDLIKKLRTMGIDYAQGYAIAKPRPLREYLDEFFKTQNISVT